jgi:hypothetical protein
MADLIEHFPNEGDLDAYVRRIADAMGMRDWKVTLDKAPPPDDDALGYAVVTYARRRVRVYLAEHDSIEELRATIVHELLHAHLEPIAWGMHNLQGILGDAVYAVHYEAFKDNVEVAVDTIAMAWAETLPLPIAERRH